MDWKHPNDMTVAEARYEAEWLESCFRDYAESGQGISTKESIRHRLCKFKADAFDQIGLTLAPGEDVWAFMQLGAEMFAPAKGGS